MNDELELEDSQKLPEEVSDSQDTIQAGESEAEKIAKLEEQNKQLFARAKKAEEEAKTLKIREDKPQTPVAQPDIEEIISAKFEERDLASLELADAIKGEVRAYAKAKGISVREAANSDYIGFLKTKQEEKIREQEASASTHSVGSAVKRDFGSLAQNDVLSLSDEDFTEYKKWLKTQS